MKPIGIRLLMLLMALPFVGTAQSHSFQKDLAWVRILPGLPEKEPFDTAKPWKTTRENFLYILSDNDLYSYFGYKGGQLYSHTDFQRYHILGSRQCIDCIRSCEAGSSSCHRNACRYGWVWALRENAKAFDSLPSVSSKEEKMNVLPDGKRWWGEDTVLQSTPKEMTWHSRVGGDCHARFEFRLYRDRYYAVYLLKEMNYYGGCRAGGGWVYSTKFPAPVGDVQFIRRTLLLPKSKTE